MQWIEISMVIKRVATEEVATLFEPYTSNGYIEEEYENHHEYVRMIWYRSANLENGDEIIASIRTVLESSGIDYIAPISYTYISDSEWQNGYKPYTQPVELLPNFVVVPVWQSYQAREKDMVYVYDNGLSFGTGEHPTTRACAKLIGRIGSKANVILDVGTGTGILLFVAHHVAPKASLYGIDIDLESVTMARENLSKNQIAGEVLHGDLVEEFDKRADLIIANLTVDPLLTLLPLVSEKLEVGGYLIISGIREERYYEIEPMIHEHWNVKEHIIEDGWHTFLLQERLGL